MEFFYSLYNIDLTKKEAAKEVHNLKPGLARLAVYKIYAQPIVYRL